MANHLPYGITQYYLPPDSSDFHALTPVKAGTRLSDLEGMQGWVDLQSTVFHDTFLHVTMLF